MKTALPGTSVTLKIPTATDCGLRLGAPDTRPLKTFPHARAAERRLAWKRAIDRGRAVCARGLRYDDLVALTDGELVGEVEQYEDVYRLCYVRGPEGIIVELAERIG